MTERDRVLDAFRNCITEPKCKDCPWTECETIGNGTIEIPRDLALAVMRDLVGQEPRVMTLEEIKESIKQGRRLAVYLQTNIGECKDCRAAGYTNFYGEDLSLRLCIQYVDISGWLEQITLYASAYNKEWRFWTSRPTDEQREAIPWDAQSQREYEAAVEMAEYCKRYEPMYNAEDGSM